MPHVEPKKPTRWTADERAMFFDMLQDPTVRHAEVAAAIGRSEESVKCTASRTPGIPKRAQSNRPTPDVTGKTWKVPSRRKTPHQDLEAPPAEFPGGWIPIARKISTPEKVGQWEPIPGAIMTTRQARDAVESGSLLMANKRAGDWLFVCVKQTIEAKRLAEQERVNL